jgi:hypothetical protein
MSIADEFSKDTSQMQNDSQMCGNVERTIWQRWTSLSAGFLVRI